MELIGSPLFGGRVYAEARPKCSENRFGGRSQGEMSCPSKLRSGAIGSRPWSSGRSAGAGHGDEARAATVCQEARAPARQHDQPVLDSDQVEEMDEEPGQPGEEAGELDARQIGDGL